jgi:hypothetical protein
MGDAATSVDVLDALWKGKVIQIGDGNGDAPIINNQGQIANQLDPPDLNKPGGYFSIILRNNAYSPPRVIYRERRYTNLFTIDWSLDFRIFGVVRPPGAGPVVVSEGFDCLAAAGWSVRAVGGEECPGAGIGVVAEAGAVGQFGVAAEHHPVERG